MQVLIAIVTSAGQAVYWLMRLAPMRRKVVMFSRQSDKPSRDFRMLAAELAAMENPPEVVIRCRRVPESLGGRIAYAGEVLAQMRELATASVCVIDTYIAPVSLLKHRDELMVIQMWHALGAMKLFGHQAIGHGGGRPRELARALKMHENCDVVLCGGEASVPAFAQAFGVDTERVLPLGLPRVDYLLARRAESGEVLRKAAERFPLLADSERIRVLYAPTFRRSGSPRFGDVVRAFSGGRFTLIVKPHDLDESNVSADHIVDASGWDVLNLLLMADVVVTDYSAIAFEAAVLDKPLYFYVPDIDDYARHGLNIDPRVVAPSVTYQDIDELAESVAAGHYTVEVVRDFKERYVSSAGSGCTRAIANLIAAHLPSTLGPWLR